VQYPFGHGLSYSNFKWDIVSVEGKTSEGKIIKPNENFVNEPYLLFTLFQYPSLSAVSYHL